MTPEYEREVIVFERLALAIGPTASLKLCQFYGCGSKTLYVPNEKTPDHEISRLIGDEAFAYLVSAFSGETICLPSLAGMKYLRRAGLVRQLSACGVPQRLIAAAIGLGIERVRQIQKQLAADGFASRFENIEPEEVIL